MRLAIADYLLRVTEPTLCATARQLGFQGVELSYGPFAAERRLLSRPGGPQIWRDTAEAAGVELAALSASYFLWHRLLGPGPRYVSDGPLLLRRLVLLAAEAGITVLHVPCFDVPPRSGGIARIHEQLAPALEAATAKNVRVALETLWPAVDCRALLVHAQGAPLDLSYDVGNAFAAGRDVPAELLALAEVLGQVRLKDRAGEEPFASLPLGEGDVDFPLIFQALRHAHFSRWLILTTPSSVKPLLAAERNAAYISNILAALEPRAKNLRLVA